MSVGAVLVAAPGAVVAATGYGTSGQAASSAPMPPAVPTPSWWHGVCDANRGGGGHKIASWDGLIACGPANTGLQESGPLSPNSEWQCVELAERWLYQEFGLPVQVPGGSADDGWQIVNDYAGYLASHKGSAPLVRYTPASARFGDLAAGDVVSYGSTDPGHVNVVVSLSLNASGSGTMETLNQNYVANGTDFGLVQQTVTKWVPGAVSGVGAATGWLHYAPGDDRPAVAVWPSGRQDVFWKGHGNSKLWETSWIPGKGFTVPVALAGATNVAGSPTAIALGSFGDELVFWKNTANELSEAYGNGQTWTVASYPWLLGSDPSVAAWASGHQDVFWKSPTSGRLLGASWTTSGLLNGPVAVPGVADAVSAPAAAVVGDLGEEVIYFRNTGGYLSEVVWAGHWETPTQFPALGLLGSDPALAVWSSGRQDIFWKSPVSDGLDWASWTPGSGLTGTVAVTGVADEPFSPAAATVAATGQEVVFWRDASGYLSETYGDGTTWIATPVEYRGFGQLG